MTQIFITVDGVTREATDKEARDILAFQAEYKAKEDAKLAEAEAKRSAVLAKLAALGLDEDDLKALGL